MMYCERCGEKIPKRAPKCPYCGYHALLPQAEGWCEQQTHEHMCLKKRRYRLLLALGLFAVVVVTIMGALWIGQVQHRSQYDFRNICWGMSVAQVQASEGDMQEQAFSKHLCTLYYDTVTNNTFFEGEETQTEYYFGQDNKVYAARVTLQGSAATADRYQALCDAVAQEYGEIRGTVDYFHVCDIGSTFLEMEFIPENSRIYLSYQAKQEA